MVRSSLLFVGNFLNDDFFLGFCVPFCGFFSVGIHYSSKNRLSAVLNVFNLCLFQNKRN